MKARQENISEEKEKQGNLELFPYTTHVHSAISRQSSSIQMSHIVQTCEHLAEVCSLHIAGVSEWNSCIQQRAISIMPYK